MALGRGRSVACSLGIKLSEKFMNALDRMPLFVWDRKVAFIEAGAGV
jgi:hypothetical protein